MTVIGPITNVIAHESSEPSGTETIDVLNPANGDLLASYRHSSAADVDSAVRSARAAFPGWAASSPAERAEALLRLASLVEDHGQELAHLEAVNAGKPITSVDRDEIPGVVDHLQFFAGAARCVAGPAAGEYAAMHTSVLRREPVGVVGQIVPWNFPLSTAVWKIAPALAAGCTCVLKPAPNTPLSAVRLAQLAEQVLPRGAFNVVVGGNATGEALVRHPDVDALSLTGSVETGRRVAAGAAESLKRMHLELGGKAPVIIFADGVSDAGLRRIVNQGLYNAGQSCVAATRVLAHKDVYDVVVSELASIAAGYTIGDTLDVNTQLGPMISHAQRARVEDLIDYAGSAEVVFGGRQPVSKGFFLEPTIIANVVSTDRLAEVEIFGPVITVERFSTEDEVVALANRSAYGLAASVWTRDFARANRTANALRCGCVWINHHGSLISEMPHSGTRQSGYGADLSTLAIDEYTHPKHVMMSLT